MKQLSKCTHLPTWKWVEMQASKDYYLITLVLICYSEAKEHAPLSHSKNIPLHSPQGAPWKAHICTGKKKSQNMCIWPLHISFLPINHIWALPDSAATDILQDHLTAHHPGLFAMFLKVDIFLRWSCGCPMCWICYTVAWTVDQKVLISIWLWY